MLYGPVSNLHQVGRAVEAYRFAWVTTVLSTIFLALVMVGGSVPAYCFVACWIPFVICHPRSSLIAMTVYPTIWIFPAFALLSTFWSEAPGRSARSAVELGATIGF